MKDGNPPDSWYDPPEPDCRREADECGCDAHHEIHLEWEMKDIIENAKEMECCQDFIEKECCPDRPLEHGNSEMSATTGECLLCAEETKEFKQAEREIREAVNE